MTLQSPWLAACLAALLASGGLAQTVLAQTVDPAPDQTGAGTDGNFGDGAAPGDATPVPVDPNAPSTLPEVNAPPVLFVSAHGGSVRVLDKLTGTTTDLELQLGAAQSFGKLGIVMTDCRYPSIDPPSESYAHLTITEASAAKPLFQGWMIASAPALSALDHPRYDVWVLTCDLPKVAKTTDGSGG
jgi:hypothetical protein